MSRQNHRILLDTVPAGALGEHHFRAEDTTVDDPGPGQLLCRVVLISVDPANRAWMQGPTYRDPVHAGDTMAGYALGEVIAENGTGVDVGTVVSGDLGWQEYALVDADDVERVEVVGPLTAHVGLLGITGLTAYIGLLDLGAPRPGDTVVVSAAAGATGTVVGQLARLHGARAVGITGSAHKNAILTGDLGFDAAVDHRSDTFADDLAAACPDGVDVYFDNVAGHVLERVLGLMNQRGRVVCCGAVSQYDSEAGFAAPGPRGVPGLLITKRLRMEGFIVLDHADRFPDAVARLAEWRRDGRIEDPVDVVEGLDRAPAALVGLLAGENVGKRMVRVGPDPATTPPAGA